ncbi:MAG: VWA domain-containing protein [Parachlamydiaceae bacterium]
MDLSQLQIDLSQFHFARPLWLLCGIAVPLVWIVFYLFYQTHHPLHQLEKFIDSHLLPYLLRNQTTKKGSVWKALFLWSIVWACLTMALAGPRWSFREMETFSRDQSLVVLLDLSESMNATDVKPSRLVRAKQKIEDIINSAKGIKIGLIAFAADPHMMTPLTDDHETIRHLLPSLGTDLVSVQGSRLSPALEMASMMLEAEPGSNKAVLVISDGGFEDASAISTAKKMAGKGVVIHAMGVGTLEGAPLQDHAGSLIKKNGALIVSKLEKDRLSEINKIGNGRYLEASYSDHDESLIINELEKRAEAQVEMGKKNRFWDEHFYLLILPILPILLWWFRKGHVFALILLFLSPVCELKANTASDYFQNQEERGKQALDNDDFESAAETFQDPYRKGVAYYKMGNFVEAEKMFRQSTRPEVAASAMYNLGNTLVQQNKLKKAVTAYKDVLKRWPDHTSAKENLELVKKMMEEQKQDSSDSDSSDQNKDQDDNESDSENNESENKDKQDRQDSEDTEGSDDKKQSKEDDNSQGQQDEPQDKPQDENQNQEPQPENNSEGNNNEDSDQQKDEGSDGKEMNENESPQENDQNTAEAKEINNAKSQEDQDADLWLNRIVNDPKPFLKNKFTIESKNNGTTQGVDPW